MSNSVAGTTVYIPNKQIHMDWIKDRKADGNWRLVVTISDEQVNDDGSVSYRPLGEFSFVSQEEPQVFGSDYT